MGYLIIVSLLWAFSPGLIKGQLTGLDSAFISAARLGLAMLVFLPAFRAREIRAKTAAALLGVGAIQFGIMYLAYNESFRYLPAYAVALFTITTPIFVTLAADALERTFRLRALLAALVAVGGAAILAWQNSLSATALTTGFILVQLSNAAFALGQVLYRCVRQWPDAPADHASFALLYAGAFLVAAVAWAVGGQWPVALTSSHFWTLIYLGVIASGTGFFLWNRGATHVSAGTLAVMNNAKIPLMVACSLLFFGETANVPRLLGSFALLAFAVWLAEKKVTRGQV